jgi:hypothetical protein
MKKPFDEVRILLLFGILQEKNIPSSLLTAITKIYEKTK